MLKQTLISFAFSGLFVLVACSDGSSNTDQSSGQDLKSSSTATEGQSCGGTVEHPKQCASGLTCVPNSTPGLQGAPGTCEKDHSTAEEGEDCGGTVANPIECASGLTCVPNSTPGLQGAPGKCVKDGDLAKEGDSCGGTVAHPKQCEPGLICVMPSKLLIGGTGTCKNQ
jgi:hypothetical protein